MMILHGPLQEVAHSNDFFQIFATHDFRKQHFLESCRHFKVTNVNDTSSTRGSGGPQKSATVW